eukprot:Lithocolla_globosa_v1_NODE_8577_length_805_cov_135.792000.p1 type:complete len:105 gc:universal NODE_8577_length_805_cov_135.792000:102-416(+)
MREISCISFRVCAQGNSAPKYRFLTFSKKPGSFNVSYILGDVEDNRIRSFRSKKSAIACNNSGGRLSMFFRVERNLIKCFISKQMPTYVGSTNTMYFELERQII